MENATKQESKCHTKFKVQPQLSSTVLPSVVLFLRPFICCLSQSSPHFCFPSEGPLLLVNKKGPVLQSSIVKKTKLLLVFSCLFIQPSMADYNRSKSYSYSSDRMQMENYYGYNGPRSFSAYPNDFRSYSVSYSSSAFDAPPALPPPPPLPQPGVQVKDWKLKKGKSANGSISKAWSFNDPEFQRKKRVASYKAYSVEGKVKGSFRRSFRWLKHKYTHVIYGWW